VETGPECSRRSLAKVKPSVKLEPSSFRIASCRQKDASELSRGICLSSSKVLKKPPRGDRYRAACPCVYGLRVAQRHSKSGEVMSLSCLFCSQFGRETAESGKEEAARKPLSTVKYFQSHWRAANFTQHLKRQHSKSGPSICAIERATKFRTLKGQNSSFSKWEAAYCSTTVTGSRKVPEMGQKGGLTLYRTCGQKQCPRAGCLRLSVRMNSSLVQSLALSG
jgi:hypothetical protein